MYNRSQSLFDAIEGYIDVLINLSSLFVGYILSYVFFGRGRVYLSTARAVLFVTAVSFSFYFIYNLTGMYRPMRYTMRIGYRQKLFKADLVAFFAVYLISLVSVYSDSRGFLSVWISSSLIVSFLFLSFKYRVVRSFLYALRKKNRSLRRIIIVGDNAASASEFIRQINRSSLDCAAMIVGYVSDKMNDLTGADKLGSISDIEKILDAHRPTEVVFAIDLYDKEQLIELVNLCDDRCIRVYMLPVIYGFFKSMGQIEEVGSIPMVNVHSTPLDDILNAALKRGVDIVGSVVLIALTLPIMIFAAVGIKLTSPGPIIFKQTRVGKMGKRFRMLKLRSMRVENNSGKEWTTDKDERKTRFGNFLRKTSIDELPQLFNVLCGTMSLVGPRPELPKFVDRFRKTIPLYMIKHYVKPGITGYAQIKGLRGDTSLNERIEADIEYIERWSLWLDITIILKTPFKAFNRNERYLSHELRGKILYDETTLSHNAEER